MTFVPKEKLSKKSQKEINYTQRNVWPISPVSRVVPNKKAYSRKKKSSDDVG